MLFCRSRYKYTWFLDRPFTSETVFQTHENAFEYFRSNTNVPVCAKRKTQNAKPRIFNHSWELIANFVGCRFAEAVRAAEGKNIQNITICTEHTRAGNSALRMSGRR